MIEIMRAASDMTWPGAFAVACVTLSLTTIAFAWAWAILRIFGSSVSHDSDEQSDEEPRYTTTRTEQA